MLKAYKYPKRVAPGQALVHFSHFSGLSGLGKGSKNNEISSWIVNLNNPDFYGHILLPILQKDWR